MDDKLLAARCLAISYRQNLLPIENRIHNAIIEEALDTIRSSNGLNPQHDRIVTDIRRLSQEMLTADPNIPYEYSYVIKEIRSFASEDIDFLDVLEPMISEYDNIDDIKKDLISASRTVSRYLRERVVVNLISTAYNDLIHKTDKINNVRDYLRNFIDEVDAGLGSVTDVDEAIINEVDFDTPQELEDVFKEASELEEGSTLFKTPWHELNSALQGGIKPGDFVMLSALEHNYKSGASLSLFRGIAEYNTPVLKDPTKKPLLVRISLEDPITSNMSFLYRSIMYNKTRDPKSVGKATVEEMAQVVKETHTKNGWHIKILRVNPSEWSYRSIQNKVTEWEADGYEVKLMMLDYLSLIPLTGIGTERGAPTGTGLRDLFRKIRNFFSSKKITLITPTQLSSTAKSLLSNGVEHSSFVDSVAGKTMTAGSRMLAAEIDIGIIFHIVPVKTHDVDDDGDPIMKYYLDMCVEKHRTPKALPETKKKFVLPFPDGGMPILDTINNKDRKILRKIPRGNISATPQAYAASSNDDFGLF